VALTGDPRTAFAPDPLDRESLDALANQMRAHNNAPADLLAGRLTSLDKVPAAWVRVALVGVHTLTRSNW
jgi:hypothetical protein